MLLDLPIVLLEHLVFLVCVSLRAILLSILGDEVHVGFHYFLLFVVGREEGDTLRGDLGEGQGSETDHSEEEGCQREITRRTLAAVLVLDV